MRKKIAIIGGTGKEGKGLAYRWAKAGHEIIIGSRQIEKAQLASDDLNLLLSDFGISVTGLENQQAAKWCEVAVLTVPYSAHSSILSSLSKSLQGKTLIDVTVPLVPPRVAVVQMPHAGSAALEAKQILGAETEIASAFQNISYERLLNDSEIDCDVLVTGTSKETRQLVLELAKEAGMIAWDAGPLDNAVVAEGLTSVLIGINKKSGSKEAGIRITGVSKD